MAYLTLLILILSRARRSKHIHLCQFSLYLLTALVSKGLCELKASQCLDAVYRMQYLSCIHYFSLYLPDFKNTSLEDSHFLTIFESVQTKQKRKQFYKNLLAKTTLENIAERHQGHGFFELEFTVTFISPNSIVPNKIPKSVCYLI